MVKLVTTDRIISIMNTVSSEESDEMRMRPREILAESQDEENLGSIPGVTQEEIPEEIQEATQRESQEEIPEETQEDQATEHPDNEETEINPPVVTTRSGREVVRPSRYAAVTKVSRNEWKQEHTEKVIKKNCRNCSKSW
jgi:hypothetical protein